MIDLITTKEIEERLAKDLVGLIARLGGRGEPVGRGNSVRYGSKGSLLVERGGPKRGQWYDFEAGIGGGPIQYIQHRQGVSFSVAMAWARDFLGMEPFSEENKRVWQMENAKRLLEECIARAATIRDEALSNQATVDRARRMWEQSKPITGTLAEDYLVLSRKIPKPDSGWPASFRFYENATNHYGRASCALIVSATDEAGVVHKVQKVFLDWNGDATGKKTLGRTNVPCTVRLDAMPHADNILQIAEGPETALTLWAATGRQTFCTLGNLASAPITEFRTIFAAIDDDKLNETSRKQRRDLIRRWKRKGCVVIPASAYPTRRQDKSDFNDLCKASGFDAVRARVDFILYPPLPKPSRVTVEEARSILNTALEGSFAKASEDDEDF